MNWGTKLTIGMILFMAFIFTLVFMMLGPHKADTLIDVDYYEKGQTFDIDYNSRKRAAADNMLPLITINGQNLSVGFPTASTYKISLRRLADAALDRTFNSDSARTSFNITPGELKSGSWLLRIEYQANQKAYLYQDKITIP